MAFVLFVVPNSLCGVAILEVLANRRVCADEKLLTIEVTISRKLKLNRV